MIANGKIQITINSSFTDGEFVSFTDQLPENNRVLMADAVVRTIDHSELSLLELRIIVPSQHADELLLGMVTGETEIAIGRMSPVVTILTSCYSDDPKVAAIETKVDENESQTLRSCIQSPRFWHSRCSESKS